MINYDLTIHFNQEKEIKDKHVKKKKKSFFLERLKSVNVVKTGVVSLAPRLKVTVRASDLVEKNQVTI